MYVNDLLIGMSTPSVGGMAFYRNPVDEVARFFNTRCVEAAPSQLHAAHQPATLLRRRALFPPQAPRRLRDLQLHLRVLVPD